MDKKDKTEKIKTSYMKILFRKKELFYKNNKQKNMNN